MDMNWINIDVTTITTSIAKNLVATVVYIFVALIIQIIANKVIVKILKRVETRGEKITKRSLSARFKTLRDILQNTAAITIGLVTFIMLMSEWGVNIMPILTGAGVLGLAIGFGSQTLVKDVVSGFFILLENQYNIGDMVEAGGVKGSVEKINLRTTILREDNGTEHIIPNSLITKVAKNFPPEEENTDDNSND